MEKLLVLAGTLAGTKAAQSFNATTLLKVIRGEEDPSPVVQNAASWIVSALATPERRELVTTSLHAILRAEDISPGELVSLAGKAAPFVGIEAPKDFAQLVDTIGQIAEPIAAKPRNYATVAVITCPKCGLVHSVGQ